MKKHIKNILVVYEQDTQNLAKADKSITQYFTYFTNELIELIQFVNIADLDENKAKQLMPIKYSFEHFGNVYFWWDVVVDCTESQYNRRQLTKLFKTVCPYFNTQFITYSTIRSTLDRRLMLK